MNPSIADFEIHLSHGRPGFVCTEAGPNSQLSFTASVTHRVGEPASASELGRLRRLLGADDPDLITFYACHNGLTLYCDVLSDAAGIHFFSMDQIVEATRYFDERFREFQMEVLYGDLMNGVVVAEVPGAVSYFVYQTGTERRGSIYYLMYDPMYDEGLRFESLPDLLDQIVANPAQFMNDLGCYTRFSDGVTDKQWIPDQYVSGD